MSRHFAFMAPPFDGHVNPNLPLVEELRKRGHRVSYATGNRKLETVRSSGAQGVDTNMDFSPPTQSFDRMTPEMLAEMMGYLLEHVRVSFPVLRRHFTEDPPDVVCYDMMMMAGPMLAEVLGVPGAALVPNFAANEHFSLLRTFLPEDFDTEHPALREVERNRAELAEELGVSPPESVFSAKPADLNLVSIPRQFQPEAETFDDRFRFLGPSLGSRATRESFTPRAPEAPLLFISLGTAFNNRPDFYRQCLDAFSDGPWQVAMSIGERLDPDELGPVPDNFDVRTRFPQPAVLEHADVFLSHTGMNSTMESLYHGVPLVAYPQMPEQRANAERAEQLGLARVLPAEVTPEILRKTVDAVSGDERMRAVASATSFGVRSGGGAVAGADALEAHLAT
ncbi:MGT family glycosyltransferase [Actinopolyspora biskrensis]|uniref:MGT family glycosyltransferase n=1 Tax=Actinopolyspora biskrensis TaxID=1470178 RepID=A0A852ZAP9_9ACTN|nr:macrolide family glycosyltransferase [Actinopolyspora biskrensis]NYH80606.1 MGT family glycosyltransferase [Actinopolyspora biskrensis]